MNALTDLWHSGPGRSVDPELSIVVPLYNEHEVLPMLHERLTRVLRSQGITYELVLVDDGSQDATSDMLDTLAASDQAVTAVFLSRNFGKEAALTAGLQQSAGQAVIMMDADLQDPPELIPQMLLAWRNGADVVNMRRRSREGESFLKRASAYCFYRVLNAVSEVDIPADTGDFRLLSRAAVDALDLVVERKRYMKGLFAWIGFPTVEIAYDRPARAAGASKWDYLSLIGLAFEGITSFSIAPLRLATISGLLIALGGVLFTLWIVVKTLVLGDPVQGYPSMISLIAVLGGAQLLAIGVLGEYIGKTYFEAKRRPVFLIRDVVRRGQPRQATAWAAQPITTKEPYAANY